MLKKIKLPKNKLACFHYHNLTEKEREYIVFNIDPVKFLNEQIKCFNYYTDKMLETLPNTRKEFELPNTRKEFETLKSIIEKLDIFDKK